jgi:hypothetical protein
MAADGGVGAYLDPELLRPVKDLKEKWTLLPSFLEVRRAAARGRDSLVSAWRRLTAPSGPPLAGARAREAAHRVL